MDQIIWKIQKEVREEELDMEALLKKHKWNSRTKLISERNFKNFIEDLESDKLPDLDLDKKEW